MPLVSGELAADVGAVNLRLALHILFAAAAADGSHVLHPEVICVSANGVNGLFEADFDFEPPAVEANDLPVGPRSNRCIGESRCRGLGGSPRQSGPTGPR